MDAPPIEGVAVPSTQVHLRRCNVIRLPSGSVIAERQQPKASSGCLPNVSASAAAAGNATFLLIHLFTSRSRYSVIPLNMVCKKCEKVSHRSHFVISG